MGIRGKFVLVIVVIALAVTVSSYLLLNRSHNQLIGMEAVRIAEIVSTQVVADRAEYTTNIVGKLAKDGTGASLDSAEKPGFVKLPAQFVRSVSERVKAVAGKLYAYSLVSQWNLNPDQALKDDFDRWAWRQLVAQEETIRKDGVRPGATGYLWKPVHRVERTAGGEVLRYMRVDPASAPACVSCHNASERQPDVMAARAKAGVPAGKQWEQHQLMGGIRVDVPLGEVAAAAAAGRNQILTGLGVVFGLGFVVLFGLVYQTIIVPVQSSVRQVEGFTQKVDAVVGCSKSLVDAADAQQGSCKKALGEAGTNGHGSNGQVNHALEELSRSAQENAMQAEEAAVYCNQLDDSFQELRGRLQRILGS